MARFFIFVAFAIAGFLGSVFGDGLEGFFLGMGALIIVALFVILLIIFFSHLIILWGDFKEKYDKELEKLKIEDE